MVSDLTTLILGSASPRRAALLNQLGLQFVVRTADIDEAAVANTGSAGIAQVVCRVARAKHDAIRSDATGAGGLHADTRLLTADTMVACRGDILGKPNSDAHVQDMLEQMSGATLEIATGVCTGSLGAVGETRCVITTVRLRELTSNEIASYVATGVGRDKAAALALQAEANHFIAEVAGCWSNVLGLPLCIVAEHECSIELCGSWR